MSGADIAAELADVPGYVALVSPAVPHVSPAPLDVRPTADFSVGTSHAVTSSLAKALDCLGDPFRPYRSIVAYCTWKVSADPDLFATDPGAGG